MEHNVVQMNANYSDFSGNISVLKDFLFGKRVIDISMNPSEQQMAVISSDSKNKNYICLFEQDKSSEDWYTSIVWSMNLNMGSVNISDDGAYLLVTSDNSTLSFLVPDPFDGVIRTEWMKIFDAASLNCAEMSGSGTAIAAGCENGKISVYHSNGDQNWSCSVESSPEVLSFSADGNLLLAGCKNGEVLLFSDAKNSIHWSFYHSSEVVSLAMSQNNDLCVVAYLDNHLEILDVKDGTSVKSFDLSMPIDGLSVSGDGDRILLWSEDRIALIDHQDAIWSDALPGESGSNLKIHSASLSFDGEHIVAGICVDNSEILRFIAIETPQKPDPSQLEAKATLAAGITFYNSGKYSDALALMAQAENLAGPTLFTKFCRGEVLTKSGDRDGGNKVYRECLDYNDNSKSRDTLLMKGIAALRLKKEKSALKLFKSASLLSPDDYSVSYAQALTEYIISGGKTVCPPPVDDCIIGNLHVDFSEILTSFSEIDHHKCFILPCLPEDVKSVLRSGMYITSISKAINAGYDIKKGDVGVLLDARNNILLGPFEAIGFPHIGRLPPSVDTEFVKYSRKNVLSIPVKKYGDTQTVHDASKILMSIDTDVLVSRGGEPYLTNPVFEGDFAATILSYFGLAERSVPYPEIGEVVIISDGDLAGSEASVTGFDRRAGTVTIELCDVFVAVPITMKRDQIRRSDE